LDDLWRSTVNAVLSGEISSYQRVDAEVVDIEKLCVHPHSVLHLTSPRVSVNIRPGGLLQVQERGTVLALPASSPRVILARVKGWIGRLLASS